MCFTPENRQKGVLWRWQTTVLTAVRSDLFVIVLPYLRQYMGFVQIAKLFAVKKLVPHSAVETLAVAILPRVSRLKLCGNHSKPTHPVAQFFAINSDPLSLQIYSGQPYYIMMSSSTSITSVPHNERLEILVRHSLIYSSMMFITGVFYRPLFCLPQSDTTQHYQ